MPRPITGTRWSRICVVVFLGLLVFVIGFAELKVVKPMCLHAEKGKEGMLSNWDLAETSYDDDDCVDTWDKVAGGVKSILSFDNFKDIDRANLLAQTKAVNPEYAVCIQQAKNYTMECPSETLYVTGCNGTQYKNACFAERDGIYAYTTENGVINTG